MQTEKEYVKEIFKTSEEIEKAIFEISKKLNETYKNSSQEVVFIIVAKGGLFYGVDLLKKINFDASIDFIFSSSYILKKKVSKPKIKYNKTLSLKNKSIVLVDDIVDSGETLEKIIKLLKKYKPKDIAVTALFGNKEFSQASNNFYCWDKKEADFIIGYGLDYDEKYRNLNYVAIAK